jgi:MFS family permease
VFKGAFNKSSPEYGWVVVAAVTTVLTVALGSEFIFGVVLKPLQEEFGWSRSALSLAVTISMIGLSIFQPIAGKLCDRIGPRPIFIGGTVLIGLSLIPLSYATELWQIYAIYGVILAMGFAAVSPVNATPLISRWFTKRRGTALAISTSGGAFGQLLIVPVAAWILTQTDWQAPFRLLAALMLFVMLPITLFFIREPRESELNAQIETVNANRSRNETDGIGLRDALNTKPFWMLAFGFFVCGFTMAFANVHFLAYADDMGMGEVHAANAIAVTAVFSIGGSIMLGHAADRRSRSHVLGLTYFLRGISFLLLLALPKDNLIFIYSLVLGVSWTATTPLTAAISADLYGRANLGVIFGTMFTFMNLGFGVGSLLDGVIYDVAGGYEIALVINSILALLAAFAVLSVPDLRGRLREAEERVPEAVPLPAD